MQTFVVTPPTAPAADPRKALDALWAFVEGIGLDPAKVVAAYASHDALALGLAVGATQAALSPVLPEAASRLFKGTNSTQ